MNHLIVFILLFGIWKIITWSNDPGNYITGILVSLFIIIVYGREFPYHPEHTLQPRRYLAFIKFLFVFLYQMIKANFVMAYRILSPGPPIKPGVVKIPLYLKSPLGRIILANSITLAPGTFTMDITEDSLYVHWIYVVTTDPVKAEEMICGKVQKILKEVFE
ncbi:MAG: Na+/H+ antiporter subunit E [Candidatus Omnitrophica bacterium]|nr:Na+/H+ antiporter subunit E [Candidatus Omnitrophota bacterium]